jgi:hypothetical protein
VPAPKLTSVTLGFRLIAALFLLALGGLMVLEAVVIAASTSILKGSLLGLLGFAMLVASIWLLRTTYERLLH